MSLVGSNIDLQWDEDSRVVANSVGAIGAVVTVDCSNSLEGIVNRYLYISCCSVATLWDKQLLP